MPTEIGEENRGAFKSKAYEIVKKQDKEFKLKDEMMF